MVLKSTVNFFLDQELRKIRSATVTEVCAGMFRQEADGREGLGGKGVLSLCFSELFAIDSSTSS